MSTATTKGRARKETRVLGAPMVDVSFIETDKREQVRAWWQTMGRFALMSLSVAALSGCVAEAKAAEHGHVWGAEECEAEQCIGRCCSKKCIKLCVICAEPRVRSETRCSGSGATGEYSTSPLTIWGPRPGGAGSDSCPPHDYGPEECGSWSEISKGCSVRHCTRQCRKCGSNGRDHYESNPPGCF